MMILKMNREAQRLTRRWIATGDARRPLACVWVELGAADVAAAAATADQNDEGGLRLCA